MEKKQQQATGYAYITVGRVTDTLAAPRWYNVKTAGEPPFPCCDSTNFGTNSGLGPAQIGMFPPGTYVLVYVRTARTVQPDKSYLSNVIPPGAIICSLPGLIDSNGGRIIDWVTPFTGADAMNNPVHAMPAQAFPTAYQDYNFNKPMDAVPGSDEGLINELGVGYGISRFFSWLRGSDMAGLWCFYLDNLVRMAAYNYEMWHSGGEHTIKNDEGEVNDIDAFTPYPWEALGLLVGDKQSAYDESAEGGIWKPGQTKLWVEPKFSDQTGLARHIVIRGYLGDMKREMVVLPKLAVTEPNAYANRLSYGVEGRSTGVLDIHQHSDGLYTVRSARGIIHEKYLFIPVPKKMAEPEQTDAKGDGLSNYNPAGYYGSTDAKEVHGKESWIWAGTRPDTWLAELYDAHAYLFNWYGIKSTVAHKKDYVIPEEGPKDKYGGFVPTTDTEAPKPRAAYLPEARLSDSFMFPLPTFVSIQVDHRTGDSRYYFTRSIIAQQPDGSVLIEDGYGSSIHLTGGNIFTTCAGDIWNRPGRSSVTWAGDDFVARAGSSADISASNGDVRLKAEKNLHMLGGNSGVDGGIIIESRSIYGIGGEFMFRDGSGDPLVGEDVKTYGIIFKSVASPMMMYGKNIYVNAMPDLTGGGGDIVLQAHNGITESASNSDIVRMCRSGMTDIIGYALEDGDIAGATINRVDKNDVVFGGEGIFSSAGEAALFRGQIWAVGPLSMANGFQTYPQGVISATITDYLSIYNTWLTTEFPVVVANTYALVYSSGIMGDPDFISEAGFTCRNTEQYGLGDDFWIVEARWQQMYRSKEIGILWLEPQVVIPGTSDGTRPHPGNDNWLTAESYVEYDPELWHWKAGSNIPRGGTADGEGGVTYPYDTARKKRVAEEEGDEPPPVAALKKVIMADHYLVSRQIGAMEESSTPE